jgi:hypothetical protein
MIAAKHQTAERLRSENIIPKEKSIPQRKSSRRIPP